MENELTSEVFEEAPKEAQKEISLDEIINKDTTNLTSSVEVKIEQKPEWAMDEADIPPAYINGEPMCVVDGKYVPYDEAQIIYQQRKVDREQAKLTYLKAKLKK